MKQQDINYYEELIVKAVQSGKSETSGLVMEIKGEIASIRHSLQDMKEENQRQWESNEAKWKDAESVLKMGKNINGFSIVAKMLLAMCVAVGSIYGIILWIQANIINK